MPTRDETRRVVIGAAGLLLAAIAAGSASSRSEQDPAPPAYRDLDTGLAGGAPFAVIGDTQETMFWESVIGRETNPAEQRQLFAQLEALRPAFLVIAGDLTSVGSSQRHWRYFDGLTAGLRSRGVPILPVLGNHDLWGSNTAALGNFTARFAWFGERHWYVRRYGALALLFLDANRGDLGDSLWAGQAQWFADTLRALETDTTVRGVLVFDHQPPFTNGTTTSDDRHVQESFVPAFLASHKALAFISGHTHAYEHFVVDASKHFVVSGGGGGPRVRLKAGPKAHADLFGGPSPRPYHFLWITPGPQAVVVEVRGFDRGETAIRTVDRFELRW